MQKKIKKLILILIPIFLLLCLIIVMLSKKIENNHQSEWEEELKDEKNQFDKIQEDPSTIINGEKLKEVKAEGIYFTIENAIKKYSDYLIQGNNEAIYNLLYEDYISQNNLKKETLLENIDKYSNYNILEIIGINTTNYGIYYSKIQTGNIIKYIMINWDTENETFSVAPIGEDEYNSGMYTGIEVNKDRIKSIKKNDYNKVIIKKVDNDSIAQKYFYDFIEKIVNNTAQAYNLLNTEYKEINFAEYNDFAEYVKENKVEFESLDHNNLKIDADFDNYIDYERYYQEKMVNKLSNYSQKTVDGVKTYIFEDSYGKYYIFKVTAAMKYTVLMDTYTIPTQDFEEEYKNSTEVEKVILNIKRFFMGIDDKNYGYSYSVISEAFKNNKYPTKKDFVNYAKQNFFEQNEIEYISYEKEKGLYIYKIKITNKTTESKELNIIMKLKDGTDFEMSFGEN